MKTSAILGKRLWRTLKKGFKQFLALLGIGTLAMTLFIGLVANAESLESRVESVYTSGNMADIYVTTDAYQENDLGQIRNMAQRISLASVVEARTELQASLGGTNAYCVIQNSVAEDVLTVSKPIEMFDLDHTTQQTFFLVDKTLYDGNPEKYSGEVEVTFNVSNFTRGISSDILELLNTFLVEGGTNIFLERQVSIKWTVTGTMNHPENIAKGSFNPTVFLLSKNLFRRGVRTLIESNFNASGIEIIERYLGASDVEDYTLPSVFPQTNQYLIKMDGTSRMSELEENIREYFGDKSTTNNNLLSVTDRTSNPWTISADSDVAGARQLCYVFPMVFFLVAVLVILTTISQIIVKERGDIGTLKATGVTTKQIYTYYIILTEIILFLASVIGAIVGPILLPLILANKYNLLYTLPARVFFYFPWGAAIISTILFLGVGALVVYLVARKELNLAPVESMRPKSLEFKRAAKDLEIIKPNPLSLSVKMAFRNIRANLVKSIMVIVGVMGCTALCVCGFGIDDTLNHGIDVELSEVYDSDIMLTYSYNGSFVDEIKSVEGVSEVEEYYKGITSISKINGDGEVVMSSSSYLNLYDDGVKHLGLTLCSDASEVTISHKVAENFGFSVGDSIRFTYGDNAYVKKVGLITDLFASTGVFTHFSSLGVTSTYSGAWVDCVTGSNVETIADNLGNLSHIQNSQSRSETINYISSLMSGISMMTLAVKVFAILLAVVVLYNLALMNYRDRTRDIATLKVLGFRKTEIALSLIMETMFLTIIGAILGLAVGYPFMYAVLFVNKIPLVDFLYYVSPLTYLLSFGISVGVGFLVSGLLSLLTDRVPMVESLKSIE